MDSDIDKNLSENMDIASLQDNQAKCMDIMCLETQVPSLVLAYQMLYGRVESLGKLYSSIAAQQSSLNAIIEKQNHEQQRCFEMLNHCQQETARSLNGYMERHIIHPAIETIVVLAMEIFRLTEIAKKEAGDSESRQRIRQEILISEVIAKEQLVRMDIELIAPAANEAFNSNLHQAVAYDVTGDEMLIGGISKLLKVGIRYRGTAIRPAKTCVFKRQDNR